MLVAGEDERPSALGRETRDADAWVFVSFP